MHTLSTSNNIKDGCLAPAFLLIISAILLFSCTSTKNIQTARVNTDSLVTHVKDSMSQVHTRETTELRRMLEEMTSSGVTFVVDSCPERELLPLLLDSTGKANYEKMLLENKLKSITNKVTISERGAITAEGNIREAKFTNTKLQQELIIRDFVIDELTKENDSLRAHKTTVIETKDKQVKRKSLFGSYAMVFGGGALCMLLFLWWFNTKRKVKSTIMNKVTLFILTVLALTSCDSHDKPTDNISFGQAWGYCWTLGAYWLFAIIGVVLGGLGTWMLIRNYRKNQNWSGLNSVLAVVLLAIVLACFLATPASIAANTTVEQAARGVYIR